MFRVVDMKIDSEGDLCIDADTGDVELATPQQTLEQNILFVVKTDHQDYTPNRFVGANLSRFIEEPNSRRKSEEVTESVSIALQHTKEIPASLLFIDTVPVSTTDVSVFILYKGAVDGTSDATIINTTLSLDIGGVDNESITNTTEL